MSDRDAAGEREAERVHWQRLARRLVDQAVACVDCGRLIINASGYSPYNYVLEARVLSSSALVVDGPPWRSPRLPWADERGHHPWVGWRRGGDNRPGFSPHICPNADRRRTP
jgi:hypothetical protein